MIMTNKRTEEIRHNISYAINTVRQMDLLKNVAVGDFYLRKFGEDRQDITFLELAQIPIGKSLPLPSVKGGSIKTTNITKNSHGRTLYFEVCWTSGATLVLHKHSDAEERIKVRKGMFTVITIDPDGHEDRFTLIAGDVVHIGAGQYHQITALEKGRMEIKFTKTDGHI